ncbi:MAG: hypothetical protein LBU17_06960 [Treponema sp.]|jgi:hypothetical protein|nr:hypothetical protein [Treponema sp.]
MFAAVIGATGNRLFGLGDKDALVPLIKEIYENDANAYTTDTMHRIFIKESINKKAFIASYYNSLSFAFSEIVGRSYGGGVLELMPSETGSIFLPYSASNQTLIDEIDALMRKKTNIDTILKMTNLIVLHEGFGLPMRDIELANSIWKKLCNRRLNRSGKIYVQTRVLESGKFSNLSYFNAI